jgi:hypothetical protein
VRRLPRELELEAAHLAQVLRRPHDQLVCLLPQTLHTALAGYSAPPPALRSLGDSRHRAAVLLTGRGCQRDGGMMKW